MKFKEDILNQVQIILKSVESIVCQISNYSESNENSQNVECLEDMWWEHEKVKNESFLFDDDIVSNYSSSEGDQSADYSAEPISTFMETAALPSLYTESALVTAICQEMEDTSPPSVPRTLSCTLSIASEGEEEEISIADRVASRRRSCTSQQVDDPGPATSPVLVSPSVRTSTASSCSCYEEEINNNNTSGSYNNKAGANSDIINNLLSCMSRVAPANKFAPLISKKRKKKMRQKKLKKVLHPDLITMWQHCSQLCAEPDVSPATPTPSPYPRVDWSRVNQRMLANLPKPDLFPVHGCAQDASFFVKRQVTVAHDSVRFWSPYEEAGSYPYGSLPGFLTQDGVIAPGGHGENVHGYVWSPDYQGWVLQATNPQKQNKDKAAFVFNKKFKRTKRPR